MPQSDILRKYADLMIRFAVNGGKGPKKDDVVQLNVPDAAKPFLDELYRAVLEAGAHPKVNVLPSGTRRIFFAYAKPHQISYFPRSFKRAEADLIDHQVSIIADTDPRELSSVDPKLLFRAMDANKQLREWLHEKEERGKFSWTVALYGTEAMAKEAGISLQKYWQQIERACFLDSSDPIGEWRRVFHEQSRIKKSLNALEIEWLHIEGQRIDLHVQLGKHRSWIGGSCRNIPSFEIFISPDWRGTSGTIFFNQPLFRYGNILRDVSLEFSSGIVSRATARVGQKVLTSMLERKNANKIGEYSLTDKRFSRITTFMANTLYDENVGGEYGNTHLALGRAYKESLPHGHRKPRASDWARWGYNDSPEHTDIISTEDRIVTATLPSGKKKIIFKDGMFTV